MFRRVPDDMDFPRMEERLLRWWEEDGVRHEYLAKNDGAGKRFSFLDGPITANNPMGVHHAWGRTYKDLFQRYFTMKGYEQRYQNGFDCQGLWVEVEVEKDLGLNSKLDIEEYGVADFVHECRERVLRFSEVQTEQSKRLGYWMDWEDSYFTMSDENNYTIWHFLKVMHERGFIYRGKDVMPWCTRCGTGLSEHEIVTEGYKELTHTSLYVRLPMGDEDGTYIMVWTTTPWTLSANVAVAVGPDETYALVEHEGESYIAAEESVPRLFGEGAVVIRTLPGSELVGRTYRGPFPDLEAAAGVKPVIIPWDEVDPSEGSGCVHIAPGCGQEDFELGQEHDLPVLAPINEFGVFTGEYGFLAGLDAHGAAEPIISELQDRGSLFSLEDITHRYPVCWRCSEELVFRLVDEWFIAMDPWREDIMDVVRQIRWIPPFGQERELDWLRNMSDWMISKKRYWGLALPIWVCAECGAFDVIGGRDELRERAVDGWEEFEGHSPHRPWIDQVKIDCPGCGQTMQRIPDVGNPWLDAGIVPYSTLHYLTDRSYWEKWFPPDFITESFPGQFRNWFYSLLAMSTALTRKPPFLTVLGHGLVFDEKGEEMHKSAGNAIWFDDATDEIGADVMRWLYMSSNPTGNVHFGYGSADEIRRRFFIPLWNIYSFFVTYARLDRFSPQDAESMPITERSKLDRWLYSRLAETISTVDDRLADYDAVRATRGLERLVSDMSNWYVRRSRRRFWSKGDDTEAGRDKLSAYQTLYEALVTTTRLLAPIVPFLAEEMYQNLVIEGGSGSEAPRSVHLTDFPVAASDWRDEGLDEEMRKARMITSLGRAARSASGIKVRQPLSELMVAGAAWDRDLDYLIKDELNVREVVPVSDDTEFIEYEVKPDYSTLGPKYKGDMPRVARAVAESDARRLADAVKAGEDIEVGGFTLHSDELIVRTHNREGFAAAADGGYTVALSTQITSELRREGLARDIIRFIQDSRKRAGFEVSDRIHVRYRAAGEPAKALDDYGDEVASEVLADSFKPGDPAAMQHQFSTTIEDEGLQVGLEVIR